MTSPVEELDKAEKEKLRWMEEECARSRKMIDERSNKRISDLTKENEDLRAKLAECERKYFQLTGQQQADRILLQKARIDAYRYEEDASYWRMNYEALLNR